MVHTRLPVPFLSSYRYSTPHFSSIIDYVKDVIYDRRGRLTIFFAKTARILFVGSLLTMTACSSPSEKASSDEEMTKHYTTASQPKNLQKFTDQYGIVRISTHPVRTIKKDGKEQKVNYGDNIVNIQTEKPLTPTSSDLDKRYEQFITKDIAADDYKPWAESSNLEQAMAKHLYYMVHVMDVLKPGSAQNNEFKGALAYLEKASSSEWIPPIPQTATDESLLTVFNDTKPYWKELMNAYEQNSDSKKMTAIYQKAHDQTNRLIIATNLVFSKNMEKRLAE